MSPPPPLTYRQIGEALACHLKQASSASSVSSLQGMISDLAVDHSDLLSPLKDLVSRQSFRALLPHMSSRGGAIQRDALIQEISRVYHPDVLIAIEEFLNGFLESTGGIASQLTQHSITTQMQAASLQSNVSNSIHGGSSSSHSSQTKVVDISQQQLESSASLPSSSYPYFNAALEIARSQGFVSLNSACPVNSKRGIIHYTICDQGGTPLARVALAMVDAKMRLPKKSPAHTQGNPSVQAGMFIDEPKTESEALFRDAIEAAKLLGNTNLNTAYLATSSKGIANYVIRDSAGTTLAKVPLSVIHNIRR